MTGTRSTPAALLGRYLAPWRRRVALLAALLLAGIAMQLLNPLIVRSFIDRAAGGAATSLLLWLAGLFFVTAAAGQAVNLLATYLSARVGWDATNLLRADLLRHALGLDLPYHSAHPPGEMIERLDGDVTALATFFSQLVVTMAANALLVAGIVLVLLWEDWRIGGAMALFVAVTLALLALARAVATPYLTAERQHAGELFGFIEERLDGLDDVRANGGAAHALNRLHGHTARMIGASMRAQARTGLVWSGSNTLFMGGYVAALAVGAQLYRQGAVSLGTVYLAVAYVQALRRPIDMLAEQFKELQRALAGIARIHTLSEQRGALVDGTRRLPPGPLALEFDGVRFAYDPAEPVLRGLSFAVPAGGTLGLLGRTGGGKSTVSRLLLRLYDVTGGAVRLNGVDVRELALAELRRAAGIVTQEVQLVAASVRDNLTFFDPTIPDARIVETLELLGLGGWLAALPAGLDTELRSDGGLSAGEAQLLAFARVFLRDPGLVILDEASSRLDPATERLIERAVTRLLAGRTAIIIAHRLATVQRCDQILILEDGRALEYGSRVALAADPGSRFSALLRAGQFVDVPAAPVAVPGGGT